MRVLFKSQIHSLWVRPTVLVFKFSISQLFSFYYSITPKKKSYSSSEPENFHSWKLFLKHPDLGLLKRSQIWGGFFWEGGEGGGGEHKNSQCVAEFFLNRISKYIWKKKNSLLGVQSSGKMAMIAMCKWDKGFRLGFEICSIHLCTTCRVSIPISSYIYKY